MHLVPASITSKIGRNALSLQKASPQVLFGVGVASVLGGTIMACRATLKMDEVLDDAADKMQKAREFNHFSYSENDRAHDLSLIRFQTGVQIVRLYAPAIILTGVGVAALTKSHRILTQRNAALTSAYAILDESFQRYRGKIIEKYGEDADRDARFDSEVITVGTGKKAKEVRRVTGDVSGYARFFDEYSSSWSNDPEVNLFFLKCQQNYVNDLLKARGHVFLNEVYDRLGMDRSEAGAVVGWILSDDGSTDNYVSFGVFEGQSENSRDFVNGRNGAVLCDFNVDGIIYDKIDKHKEDLSWQLGQ